MSVTIIDRDIDEKLAEIGARQAIPVDKTKMAREILRRALIDSDGLIEWLEQIKDDEGAQKYQ